MSKIIEQLESKLTVALVARPAALEAIAKRIEREQAVVEGYRRAPLSSPDKALEALGTIGRCHELLAILGEERQWGESVKAGWLTDNFTVLVGELEKKIEAEAAKRAAYRQASAEKVGELSKQIVLKDGDNAPESELSNLSRQLAEIERDLEKREAQLSHAQAAIRDLIRAKEAPRQNAYQSLFEIWTRARDAALGVNFAIISEAVSPRERGGAS